jgi:hypothetical protein
MFLILAESVFIAFLELSGFSLRPEMPDEGSAKLPRGKEKVKLPLSAPLRRTVESTRPSKVTSWRKFCPFPAHFRQIDR